MSAQDFAKQAVSLTGKERLYERATTAEAWVIRLQEDVVRLREENESLREAMVAAARHLRDLPDIQLGDSKPAEILEDALALAAMGRRSSAGREIAS